MKKYSIYVWALVLVGLASGTIPFASDVFIAQNYGAGEVSKYQIAQLKFYAAFIGFLENIVSAIWLGVVAVENKSSRVSWSLFGLVYGLWAVAIFYLLSIYELLVHNQANPADAKNLRG